MVRSVIGENTNLRNRIDQKEQWNLMLDLWIFSETINHVEEKGWHR